MQSWLQPVSVGKRQLLAAKWGQLPPDLQTDNQILGKHWIGCGYTMGPAYCSFGCTHCYLPKSSNRVPLVSLELMKEQIVAQRKLLGAGGNLQITGGDVVEAYWRQGKSEELIEILKFATDNELIPMLMTHGQILLENPDYFADLVSKGGLRKVSIHIDTTMAGRPGFPIRSLFCEDQLNPLRDEFVELVLEIRRRTGKLVVAAQTVTVTESNIHSVGDILIWLMSEMKNMDVCRTIIFQPEARVGRTRSSKYPVTPEQVWQQISQSTGQALSRDHLLVGHPDCSSIATLLVRVRDRKVPGVGKSHLVQSIGLQLIRDGFTVYYRSIFDCVRDFLHDEAFEGHDRILKRYLTPDLLILDDMGMKQLPKKSGEFLFEIIMRRHELRSTKVFVKLGLSIPMSRWSC